MKHKLLSILGILVLVMGLFPSTVFAAPPPPNYSPVDVGPRIREMEATAENIGNTVNDALAEAAPAVAAGQECVDTDNPKIFMILDDVTGQYGLTYFLKYAESSKSVIYVQRNLSWPAGDPRPAPVITCDQANYMLGEFDNVIYPKESAFFGTPAPRNGTNALLPDMVGLPADYYSDPAGRQIVLVSNIRDANYYDSNYPIYIAGFFSPSFALYFDRNVMSIDAFNWADRTGPSGSRPYLYEGVFTHEYQHLLHNDYDSDEDTWVNEGMSDLAEEIVGFFASLDGHLKAAVANPENSLTLWGDQGDLEILTDYGQAYFFQKYLLEKYGSSFTQALFHNPENGIAGVNSTLAALKIKTTFASIYHDWSVAMLINSPTLAGGRYGFKDARLSSYKMNIGTPANPNPEAYSTPGAPPWGTDYLWINGDPKKLAKLLFDGVELSTFPSAWTSVDGALWGGAGDLLDNWAIFETTGGGTLTFETKYDIEQYWDFGFVQVSTNGGQTWTSLANDSTTSTHDPSAHPKVIANLPGLTGTTEGAWAPMSYDLSAYAGQSILVGFRYVTDWATSEAGWYIKNVQVDGNLIADGTSMAPFKDLTYYRPISNDFTVTFVGIKEKKGKGNEYKVMTMKLSELQQKGLFELNAVLKDSTSAVMLVTLDAAEDAQFYVDYTYSFGFKGGGPKKTK